MSAPIVIAVLAAFAAGACGGWLASESRHSKRLRDPDPSTFRATPGASGKVRL